MYAPLPKQRGLFKVILISRFDGDDDVSLKNAQYEVYGSALHMMIDKCSEFARFARILLDDTEHADWDRVPRSGYDHRKFQTAHDLLAAAWRYKTDARQLRLPFPPLLPCIRLYREAPIAALWLEWLHDELSAWTDHPDLVRSVLVTLHNQDDGVGDAAKFRLCRDIIHRFSSVPWSGDLHKRFNETSTN